MRARPDEDMEEVVVLSGVAVVKTDWEYGSGCAASSSGGGWVSVLLKVVVVVLLL